jgi:SHS2 domain-containing protein
MKYKILEHIADLKIKVWGKDLPELFKNAVAAMYQAMAGKSEIRSTKSETNSKSQILNFKLAAQDYESLLVNFLNELLYLSDVENGAYQVLDLEIRNLSLKAKLCSYPLPPLEVEIKGATYHNLKIKKINNLYETIIVFDI